MANTSYIVKIRPDRANKEGEHPLMLQLFINKQKLTIALNIWVNPNNWNPTTQQLKQRDTISRDKNLLIENIKAKVNKIIVDYRLANQQLTPEKFKTSYKSAESSNECFIQFYRNHLFRRNHRGEIESGTFRAHRATLHKLENIAEKMPFNEISIHWLDNIKTQIFNELKRQDLAGGKPESYHINTMWNQLKNIRTYLNIAKKHSIKFTYPFTDIKLQRAAGNISFLSKPEIKTLLTHYRTNIYSGTRQKALETFLFCAFTSIRITDAQQLTTNHIQNNEITFTPGKTKKQGKTVTIPITTVVSEILQNKKSNLLPALSQQKINKHLKQIAHFAGIGKKLSTHVARHTFATMFLREGGQVHVLKEILGHSDIKTTMIYVGLEDSHKRSQMDLLNQY